MNIVHEHEHCTCRIVVFVGVVVVFVINNVAFIRAAFDFVVSDVFVASYVRGVCSSCCCCCYSSCLKCMNILI